MDQYSKAQYVRRRLNVREKFNKVKLYAFIGATVLGFAYLADKYDASEKIETGASKTKQGIEYVLNKF